MLYPTKLEATTPVLLLNSRHVGIQLSFYEKSLRQHPLRLSIHVLKDDSCSNSAGACGVLECRKLAG